MPGSAKRENQAERLQAIRLRYTINTHLEDQVITTPAQVGAATGLPAAEAARLRDLLLGTGRERTEDFSGEEWAELLIQAGEQKK